MSHHPNEPSFKGMFGWGEFGFGMKMNDFHSGHFDLGSSIPIPEGNRITPISQNPIPTLLVFKSHSNSDFNSNHEPNTLENMVISIPISFDSDSIHEPNAP